MTAHGGLGYGSWSGLWLCTPFSLANPSGSGDGWKRQNKRRANLGPWGLQNQGQGLAVQVLGQHCPCKQRKEFSVSSDSAHWSRGAEPPQGVSASLHRPCCLAGSLCETHRLWPPKPQKRARPSSFCLFLANEYSPPSSGWVKFSHSEWFFLL